MRVLLDIVHYDAPLGLGLILQNLEHEWYVPFTTRWKNIAGAPPPPGEGYLNLETERFVIHGARVYYDTALLRKGFFDLVITSRWDCYPAIQIAKHPSTRLAFYLADRHWRPPSAVKNVISGVKGPWYFTKRVPDYWFRRRSKPQETLLTSMVSNVEENNARLHRALERRGDPFPRILAALKRHKVPYRLHGRNCRDEWCYDQVAYDQMSALLHVKPWGSGSDWAVLKACAKGIPCVVYQPYVVKTMHEEILARDSNVFLTWADIQGDAWVKRIERLEGEGNRTALRSLYDRGVPEAQVRELLRRMK